MWRRNGLVFALGLSAACLDVATAPIGETPAEPHVSSQTANEHLWVFHVGGGRYAAHVQLIAIREKSDNGRERGFRPQWSRAWDGSIVNDFADFRATAVDTEGLSWSLHNPATGETLRLDYKLIADTALGALTLGDGTRYPVLGVRFDSAAVNLLAPGLPPTSYDTLPAVLIRLDDASVSDRDFLRRLAIRGLVAEIAVPTQYIGLPKKLTWEDLKYWRTRGMGVVAHSRYHLSTSAGGQHFVGEMVGGMAELAAHGFTSHIFVQPGTWRDSIYFDSPAKLHTWRGALLRTFTTVSECYAYGNWLPGRADSLRLGLAHATISDGKGDDWIREAWHVALRRNYATVFLVHSYRLKTPDQLDWFLDLVADAQARGVVRVAGNSDELFSGSKQEQVQGVQQDTLPRATGKEDVPLAATSTSSPPQ